MTDDDHIEYDFLSYVMFFNANPEDDLVEASNEIWQHEHLVDEYCFQKASDFTKEVLTWIVQKRPEGNYSVDEIESRLSKM